MTSPTRESAAGTRQVGLGAVLLVVGVVVAFLLVQAGVDTLAMVGYVLAVAGIALIGNGLLLRRKGSSR